MRLQTIGATCCFVTIVIAGCRPVPAGPSSVAPNNAVCGDQDREGRETCDGADLGGETCLDLGFGSGGLACQPNCRDFDRSGCGAPAGCGDNQVQDPEICDGTDIGGRRCEDLGLGAGVLGCLGNCADYDTVSCGPPLGCGDGARDGVEVCDGEDFDGLRCRDLGYEGGTLRCAEDCMSIDLGECGGECQPTSCIAEGKNCGDIPNGCGSSIGCGSCSEPESCGGSGVANVCGQGSCIPTSCIAEGKNCDQISDGCGSTLSCGSCSGPESCGGGGVTNVCGCTAVSCATAGKACGFWQNNCGQTVDCGPCAEGTCGADNQCVVECVPNCSQQQCGLDPNCGFECGPCGGDEDCISGQCLPRSSHCSGYSEVGRLNACGTDIGTCADPFECVGGGLFSSAFCADADPCGSEPAARCCGQGEFCGTSSFSFTGEVFCCSPDETLVGGVYPESCIDAGLEIGCSSAADCPAAWGRGICATWRSTPVCVECDDDGDCGDTTPACDLATNTCVACTADRHCGNSSLPACDTTSQTCVACTGHSYCGSTEPWCDDYQTCAECLDDGHCQGGAEPRCASGSCVACLDDDDCAAPNPYCISNACVVCPMDFILPMSCQDMASGRRACFSAFPASADECAIDADCGDGLICDAPTDQYLICTVSCP